VVRAGLADPMWLLVLRLDHRRYALPLSVVERVIRAVDVTPLPRAPLTVRGAINVHGHVLPVLSLRRRFGLPDREVMPTDVFVLARAAHRRVALIVDEPEGVLEPQEDPITASAQITHGLTQFFGVTTLDDDLVLIHDLAAFLSLDDSRRLDEAMRVPFAES